MYPEYKESDSILIFLKIILTTISKKVKQSRKFNDIIPYIRNLRDILEFRTYFSPHISHGDNRTGFRGTSETMYNICGTILLQYEEDSFTFYKNNLLKQLNRLLRYIELSPIPRYNRSSLPKREYHHPRNDAPQYFYS